jgi:hypothetical protein
VVAAVLVAFAVLAAVVVGIARSVRQPPSEPISMAEEVPSERPPALPPEQPAAAPESNSVPQETPPTNTPTEYPSTPPQTPTEKPTAKVVRPVKPADGPEEKAPPTTTRKAPKPVASRPASRPEREPKPAPKKRGTAVIVIDDAGNNLRELDPFLRFPGPLTIAVLPGLPHSAEAARRARAAGKEVLLHQPMEAINGQNPGPGAIRTGMNDDEIRAILRRNVAEVGPVVGMNNHQGSKVTMDERTMRVVLEFCRERRLLFLDSRTTADSVVPQVATTLGMNIRERDVFVDNIQERAAMIRYLQEGLQKAEKKGSAIMIGHAWSSDLASTLQELYPELIEQGFSLSSIAQIMMGTYDDEGLGD